MGRVNCPSEKWGHWCVTVLYRIGKPGGIPPSLDKKLRWCFQKDPIFLSSWKAGSSLRRSGRPGAPHTCAQQRVLSTLQLSVEPLHALDLQVVPLELCLTGAGLRSGRCNPHRHRRSARSRGGGACPAPRRRQTPTGRCETLTRPDHPR